NRLRRGNRTRKKKILLSYDELITIIAKVYYIGRGTTPNIINSIPTHKWLKTLYLILHIIQDLTAESTGLRRYQPECRGIDRTGEISTGVSSESTGQRKYQPECRVNQTDRGKINRNVE